MPVKHSKGGLEVVLALTLTAILLTGCSSGGKYPAPSGTAPSITTQPQSQTVTAGSAASFTIAATGTAPLAYQWMKNSAAISGATSTTLQLSSVATGDAGNYAVSVTNVYGSATSSAAILTVNAPLQQAATPVITPAGGSYTSAQTITITDATTGASIYYTLDGTAPTASSTKYAAPIAVSSTATINAIAIATGYTNSPVATAVFTFQATQTPFDPGNPASSGYELVFDDEFNSLSTILTSPADGQAPTGFNWYVNDTTLAPPLSIEFNSAANSNVLVIGPVNPSNYDFGDQLSSAGTNNSVTGNTQEWRNRWNGHSFGGGAYFEARIGFDETLMPGYNSTTNPYNSWPGFWSKDISVKVNNGAQFPYPDQPTYANYVEDDFLEWGFNGATGNPPNLSTSSLHNWVGVYQNSTCTGGSVAASGCCDYNNHGQGSNFNNYKFTVPFHDWTNFHVIGQLWVPATAASGANDCASLGPPWNTMATGFVQNYVDGVPYTRTFWCGTVGSSPPPSGYSIFSGLDRDHLFLILQGSIHGPVKFDWVHVWQLPAAAAASGNSPVSPQAGFTGGSGSRNVP